MKILIVIFVVIILLMCPTVRFSLVHPFKVVKNAVVDVYRYFRYKRYNEFKDYGRMTMYIANDSQPFGSGKTLNLVRYINSIYRHYNGLMVWSHSEGQFVPQEIRIYSNIKLNDVPYIPLYSEQQIVEASELGLSHVVQLFVLDEMGTQWNNRNWKSNLTEDLLNAILQQRKSKIAIVGTVQDFSLFDATLRKLTTNVYECSKKWRFLVLREYYASDIERAQNNVDLIECQSKFVRFATDRLYNSYDTSEKVAKICKDVVNGDMLTNQEILDASDNNSSDVSSLTRIRKKYKKRVNH